MSNKTSIDVDVHALYNTDEVNISANQPATTVSLEEARKLAERIESVANHADSNHD